VDLKLLINISSNIKVSYEKGIIKLSKLIETVPDPLLKKAILEEKKGIY
jgi:hypothetical protein